MNNNKRLISAILISFLLHCFFVSLFIFIQKPQENQQKKIKLENLLVLKRGQSQDPTKNTQGAKKPSIASQNNLNHAPTYKQNTKNLSKQESQTNKSMPQENTQTKKQIDSQKKSIETYQPNHFDPKNLSLLNQEMQLEARQSQPQISQENDKGRDTQTIQEINELYGEEFGDFGSAQKDFIKNNLRNIGRITQQYLTYPRVAAYFEQSGINAVEFYLHPNGDITDLKIIKSSGLKSFDSATLNTIKIAYKDYPRPQQKTLIRIKVTYSYFGL